MKRGTTLIELLIVVAIIGILVQLTIPAIQSSREAARRAQCQNNLRQLTLAVHSHVAALKYFPTGGWTHVWVGDPNRGFDKKQPGGWCYNLLPYLEEGNLHDLGKGMPDAERRVRAVEMFSTPVDLFICPSRRYARSYRFIRLKTMVNIDEPSVAGRSDYAANMGNLLPIDQRGRGPASLDEGDQWVEGTDPMSQWISSNHNGIIYQRSTVRPAMIEDGLSKTYMIGEKFMNSEHYESGETNGDDQSLYVGFDRDNERSGHFFHPPMRDKVVPIVWLRDSDSPEVTDWNFGSAHPTGFHMAFCDGSVRQINYDVSSDVHSAYSSRNDAKSTGPD